MKRLYIFLIFILFSTQTYANNTIQFIRVDFPPLWITQGTLKDQGIADAGEEFLKSNLSQYNYQHIDTTVARAQKLMSSPRNETYCAVPHGKGFFENVIESQVWVAISGHVLVSTKEKIEQIKQSQSIINQQGQLKLEKFLETQPQLTGLITKGQKYPIVDDYTQAYKNLQIQEVVTNNMLNLYDMVEKDRADYTFQYESTIKYLQKTNHAIEYLTIEELNNHKVLIVVGCNDTPLAKEFIHDINNNIKALKKVGLQKMREYHSPLTFENIKSLDE